LRLAAAKRVVHLPAPPMSTLASTAFVDAIRERVGKVVVGQEAVVERLLIALFTGGHLLLQGMPGLAKTLLVNTLAKAIDLQFSRVQFTIDLLPSDIVGSEILDQPRASSARIRAVFTNLLLAMKSIVPPRRCRAPCSRRCRNGA
jgi:MoxR-like ATPase